VRATLQNRPWTRWAAWGFWLLIFCVVCGDVIRRPLKHNTTPTYRLASAQWWAGQDPYTYHNHDGFLYLPQAAMVFTPFTWGPLLLGEVLWRVVVFGLFGYALIRLQAFFLSRDDRNPDRTFLILSLLAVPSAMASLRNAQFDLPLAALLILATAEIAVARWNLAAVWLCLGVALKPLAVVPLLLFGALYRKLIPRLAAGLLIVFLLPFLRWNPAYAAHEYVRCVQTLAWATQASEPRYSDLGALLSHLSIYPPDWLKTLGRLVFALVFFFLGWSATRRLPWTDAVWTVGALSATYLMLFNPRTETCSFVFIGPFTASLALRYARNGKLLGLSYALGFASLGFACDAIPVVHGLTDRWLKPLLALLFLPVLIHLIFGFRPKNAKLEETANAAPGRTF
jgi:alpha-1,2-mannosyltransferase